jgi:hypothetical protein
MKALQLIAAMGAVAMLACGCQSSNPIAPVSEAQASSATHPTQLPNPAWSKPEDLPAFGTPTADSIRVVVWGRSVMQPGWYYLPRGSTIHDAMVAAEASIHSWPPGRHDYLQRIKADGSLETIRFLNPTVDEQRSLQDGDHLKFSHEVW